MAKFERQSKAKFLKLTLFLSLPLELFSQEKIEGRYHDNSGSHIQLNAGNTFNYVWHFDLASSWTKGTWELKGDTVYFRMVPVYDTVSHANADGSISDTLIMSDDEISERVTREQYVLTLLSTGGQNRMAYPDKLLFKEGRLYKNQNENAPNNRVWTKGENIARDVFLNKDSILNKQFIDEMVYSFDSTFKSGNAIYIVKGFVCVDRKVNNELQTLKTKDLLNIIVFQIKDIPELWSDNPEGWFVMVEVKHQQPKKTIRNNLKQVNKIYKNNTALVKPDLYLNDELVDKEFYFQEIKKMKCRKIYYINVVDGVLLTRRFVYGEKPEKGVVRIWTKN